MTAAAEVAASRTSTRVGSSIVAIASRRSPPSRSVSTRSIDLPGRPRESHGRSSSLTRRHRTERRAARYPPWRGSVCRAVPAARSARARSILSSPQKIRDGPSRADPPDQRRGQQAATDRGVAAAARVNSGSCRCITRRPVTQTEERAQQEASERPRRSGVRALGCTGAARDVHRATEVHVSVVNSGFQESRSGIPPAIPRRGGRGTRSARCHGSRSLVALGHAGGRVGTERFGPGSS